MSRVTALSTDFNAGPCSRGNRRPDSVKWQLSLLALALWAMPGLAADYDTAQRYYRAGDYPRAYWTFRPLAEAGDPRAQYKLGRMYENGHGMTANPRKAVRWYRKAVSRQLPDAQWALGKLYTEGRGVPKDDQEAVRWFRRAAARRHAAAQVSLGVMYQQGTGVAMNYGAALAWYLKAAERGVPSAFFNLGVLHQNGYGVEQNFVKAYRWYDRATGAGIEKARRHREALMPHMTPAQLAAAGQPR